jgi:uncharacterized membrane protein YuzA (DUF378 family)
MNPETLLAALLFALVSWHLWQRNLAHMVAWIVIIYLVGVEVARLTSMVALLVAIAGLYMITQVTKNSWENFENETEEKPSKKKEEESKPEPAPPKTSDPHVDVGTTILHAYRNLSPEQIGGMRRDTKELLGLQKELMGSLSEMKPAIEQGAELLKTFSTFFGKPGEDGAAPPGL